MKGLARAHARKYRQSCFQLRVESKPGLSPTRICSCSQKRHVQHLPPDHTSAGGTLDRTLPNSVVSDQTNMWAGSIFDHAGAKYPSVREGVLSTKKCGLDVIKVAAETREGNRVLRTDPISTKTPVPYATSNWCCAKNWLKMSCCRWRNTGNTSPQRNRYGYG